MNHLTVALVNLETAQVFTAPREGGGTIAYISINRCINVHLEGADPGSQANELRRLAGTFLGAADRIDPDENPDLGAPVRFYKVTT